MTNLFIMLLGPADLLQDITEVSLDWNVVLPRLEVPVEVLIILRVLFEHEAVPRHEVRESVGSHCAVYV